MAVEGPSKAEISCHDNKDGTVSVSYLPTAPGEYKVSVKFDGKHIRGSPYNAKITGELNKFLLLRRLAQGIFGLVFMDSLDDFMRDWVWFCTHLTLFVYIFLVSDMFM